MAEISDIHFLSALETGSPRSRSHWISESFSLSLQMATLSLYTCMVERDGESERQAELFGVSCYKDTNTIVSGPYPMILFELNFLLVGPISIYSRLHWGLGFSTINLGGT